MSRRTSRTRETTTSNSTATSTPNTPGYIQQPVTDYFGQVGNLLNGMNQNMPATYGPTSNQQAAFAGAAGLNGNSGISQGMDATRGLLNFQPMNVNGWNAPAANQNLNQASSATQGLLNYTPDAVTAGQLSSTDLNSYMNPFQRDVIDAAGADFQNANQAGLNQLNTVGNGAWGGSRSAVAQGQLVGDNTRNFAQQIAALRAANFGQAQQAALADIGNRFSADQFNVGSGLQGANFRLGAANQLGQLGLAGDENTRANVGLSHGIDMDRANLGLQGAGVRLNAANQLYNQGAGADANSRANIATQAGLGQIERDIAMENDPTQQRIRYLAQLQELLGVNPESLFGQTMNQSGSGTRTGRTTQTGVSIGWSPQNGFSIGG